MLIDEFVDPGLIGWIDFFKLQAHPNPPIAPGHTRFRLDIAFRAR
jgi:hypothetical protein